MRAKVGRLDSQSVFRKGQVKSVLLHKREFAPAGLAKGRMMSVGAEVMYVPTQFFPVRKVSAPLRKGS